MWKSGSIWRLATRQAQASRGSTGKSQIQYVKSVAPEIYFFFETTFLHQFAVKKKSRGEGRSTQQEGTNKLTSITRFSVPW
jgi:hypothetical protein